MRIATVPVFYVHGLYLLVDRLSGAALCVECASDQSSGRSVEGTANRVHVTASDRATGNTRFRSSNRYSVWIAPGGRSRPNACKALSRVVYPTDVSPMIAAMRMDCEKCRRATGLTVSGVAVGNGWLNNGVAVLGLAERERRG